MASFVLASIGFIGLAYAQAPGFTGVAADTAWVGPAAGVNISYTLTDAVSCDVYLQVTGAGGQPVRTIGAGMEGSGTYSIAWDGCYADGTHVPEGDYTLQVYAVDYGALPDQLTGQWQWFLEPHSVAADASGNVYVLDYDSLRLFSPGGGDTTLFQWADPLDGMVVDSAGNVYAVDANNSTVYAIHPGGNLQLLAAGLDNVTAMAVDGLGDVFVACGTDDTVKEIFSNGTVATIGLCPDSLMAMTADATGDVYLIGVEGTLEEICADGTNGTVGMGLFGTDGMAVGPDGSICLSDVLDHSVKRYTPGQGLVTLSDEFLYPGGLAVGSNGDIYVIEQGESISYPPVEFVEVLHPDGTVANLGTTFNHPSHITAGDPGSFYLVDHDGQIMKVTGTDATPVLDTNFYQPSIAVTANGTIYVADRFQSSIQVQYPDGTMGTIGYGLCFPSGIAADAAGDVYVADTFDSAVKVIYPNGTVDAIGSGFVDPWDVAVDPQGNVYVTDGIVGGTISKIAPDGTTTVLDSGYSYPDRITVDKGGVVYFLDNDNNSVLAIFPDGTEVTLVTLPDTIYDVAADAAGNLYIDGYQAIYEISRLPVIATPVGVHADMTPPVTTCQLSGAMDKGAYVDDAQVTLAAADSGAGVYSTEYRLDSGDWASYTGPFDVTDDGVHTIYYRSTDNVGNVEAAKSTIFKVGPVKADFTADVTSGGIPFTVWFQDRSQGGPTSWTWDFGDGVHSNSPNRLYTYKTAGNYTVSLTVSDGFGSDTMTKSDFIQAYLTTATFTIPLSQGWNLISTPLANCAVRASSLASDGVTEVASYNTSTGRYDVYLEGLTPDDFALQGNEAYFLYCSRAGSITVSGNPPIGITATLQAGWNAAGWSTMGNSDARSAAASLAGTQEIARYDTAAGGFDVYLEGRTPSDFDMKPGEGYFVFATAPCTIDYDALGGD